MTNEKKIPNILAGIQNSLPEMHSIINSIGNGILKTNIKIETDVTTKLDALADGHTVIIEQLTPRSRINDMEREISLLKTLVYQRNNEAQKLKAV